jgi:hypothetical protein
MKKIKFEKWWKNHWDELLVVMCVIIGVFIGVLMLAYSQGLI